MGVHMSWPQVPSKRVKIFWVLHQDRWDGSAMAGPSTSLGRTLPQKNLPTGLYIPAQFLKDSLTTRMQRVRLFLSWPTVTQNFQ